MILRWMNLQQLSLSQLLYVALISFYRIILLIREKSINSMENELKQLIIDALDLEAINVAEIDSREALFNDGLGLDSIDALELGLAIRKKI